MNSKQIFSEERGKIFHLLQLLLSSFRKDRALGLRSLNTFWKCDQLIDFDIQSAE